MCSESQVLGIYRCTKIRSQWLNERYTSERVGCLYMTFVYPPPVRFLFCFASIVTTQFNRLGGLCKRSQWLAFSPGATRGHPSCPSGFSSCRNTSGVCVCKSPLWRRVPFICLCFALIPSLNTLLRTQPHRELLKVGLLHEFGSDVIQLIAGSSPTQVLAGRLERSLIRAMLEMANWRKLIAPSSHMQRPNMCGYSEWRIDI